MKSEPNQETPRRTIWQKIGFGSLSISIFVHICLLAAGLFWIFQVIPQPGKEVEFLPRSGGGGSPSAASHTKTRVQMRPPATARVVAEGATGSFVLPDPEQMSQIASLGGGFLSSLGRGGLGSGGGLGNGKGLGTGDGLAPGTSTGNGSKNPFGALTMDTPGLVGTFYDLKQTSDRKPTEMTDDGMRMELKEITRRGFRGNAFDKYFKAPRTLYQNKLMIPRMTAEGAPAAFEVEKEVQPKRWLVVYRGMVKAPSSGRFRFVAECDDTIAIRFNNRPVFDYGYTIAGTGTSINGRFDEVNGTKDNRELAKEIRRLTPMKVPIGFYQYPSVPSINSDIGGMAVGPEFEVTEGRDYPIEIMIGEIPGGYFSVALMIEKIGETYKKEANGAPILPLFRTDHSLPDPDIKGEQPPFDPNGPVWKVVSGTVGRSI